jgi:hypothetical protein
MSLFETFHVDLPGRCQTLHEKFSKIAKDKDLEVTYTLMRLGCAFLMPFEQSLFDLKDRLEINSKFGESSYCCNYNAWTYHKVPEQQYRADLDLNTLLQGGEDLGTKTVREVLFIIRCAIAHSNLHFAAEQNNENIPHDYRSITHIFFGIQPADGKTEYRVIGSNPIELSRLLDIWSNKLSDINKSSYPEVLRALGAAPWSKVLKPPSSNDFIGSDRL